MCNNTLFPLLPNFESDHPLFPNLESNSNYSDQLPHTTTKVMEETKKLGAMAGANILTSLLIYSRTLISMIFLGRLGGLELAGGSLSIGFGNITGYSILAGLAMGMEPICSQAFGANRYNVFGLTLQRTVLLLLSTSLPISLIWLNIKTILLRCGYDKEIATIAGMFSLFSLPDLIAISFLHPIRIYLRTQNITLPLTYCSFVALVLHVPINFLLIKSWNMGVAGVALAMVWTNFNLVLLLSGFVYFSNVYQNSWVFPTMDCLKGWKHLLQIAIPSCISVCLEWWWYEFIILLCGLLANPKAAIASTGILMQTTALIYIFPSALGSAASTRVGNELGAGRPGVARISTAVSMAGSAIIGLAAMLFNLLLRKKWGRLFTSDVEVLEMTAAAMPIVGLCELGNCPQTTGCGVLRGSARPITGAYINLGSFYMVGMPVAVLIAFVGRAGFVGLWLGLLAAQACCATMMVYKVARTDWVAQAHRAQQLTNNDAVVARGGGREEETERLATSEETDGKLHLVMV